MTSAKWYPNAYHTTQIGKTGPIEENDMASGDVAGMRGQASIPLGCTTGPPSPCPWNTASESRAPDPATCRTLLDSWRALPRKLCTRGRGEQRGSPASTAPDLRFIATTGGSQPLPGAPGNERTGAYRSGQGQHPRGRGRGVDQGWMPLRNPCTPSQRPDAHPPTSRCPQACAIIAHW